MELCIVEAAATTRPLQPNERTYWKCATHGIFKGAPELTAPPACGGFYRPKDPMHELKTGVTVGKLRAMLAEHPDDMPVIVLGVHGADGETPVSDVSVIWYEPISTWAGCVHHDYPDDEPYRPTAGDVRCLFIGGIN